MAKYITPAVTPLTPSREPDEQGMRALYEHLIRGGVDGILVLGSIGEFFALPLEAKRTLIAKAVKIIGHRVPLLVGTGGMVYDETVELSVYALEQGADGVVIVPPYYFPLTGASLEEYYDSLCAAIPGKVYLYNFPDRTGYEIPVETVVRLAGKHKNLVGIKDTISGMDHTRELIKAVKPVRPDFEIYSGFDDNFAHNVLSGGDGCIGGLSNLVPELCHEWVCAVTEGDWKKTCDCQQKINRLMSVYGVGTPFVPYIKCALGIRGIRVDAQATFPLAGASAEQYEALTNILRQENLIQ